MQVERSAAPQDVTPRARAGWAVAALVLALLPVLVVVVTRVGRAYVPLGDEANIALRVRDVFTGDSPLVGAYSQGFSHPGPLLFWLLAPLSALFGDAPWTTLVGGALLQGSAIAASAWVAFRRGGTLLTLLVLAALGLGYSSLTLGTPFLQAWNPAVAFPFFMLLLLLAWSAATGSRWSVLGAALVATLLVQLHVGYLPVIAAIAVWVLVVVALDARAAHREPPSEPAGTPRWSLVLGLVGVSLLALWLVPLVEQLTSERGNLGAIVDQAGSGDAVGLPRSAGIVAAEFAVPPPWLGGEDRFLYGTTAVIPSSTVWLLVPALLLAGGYLAAMRSGRIADRRLVELATVTLVAAIVAIAAVRVDPSPFIFSWRVLAALLVLVAAAWATAGWLDLARRPRPRRVVVVALLVVIAVSFGVRAIDVLEHRDAIDRLEGEATALFDRIERVPTSGRVLVRGLGTTHGLAQGLVDELDRRGVDVRVDPAYGFQYGEHRVARPDEVDEIWYVSHEGRHRVLLGERGDGEVIGAVSGLTPGEERDARALQRSLADALTAGGRADLLDQLDSPFVAVALREAAVPGVAIADAERLAELNAELDRRDTCRCTVIAYPAAGAPELPFSMGY